MSSSFSGPWGAERPKGFASGMLEGPGPDTKVSTSNEFTCGVFISTPSGVLGEEAKCFIKEVEAGPRLRTGLPLLLSDSLGLGSGSCSHIPNACSAA